MQLSEFRILGLFDAIDHRISFPTSPEDEPRASVTILHGPNGIGKTTLLRMLDGLMKLEFTIFRQVPFNECVLTFNSGDSIAVQPERKDKQRALFVRFKGHEVRLHPHHPGALADEDKPVVERFRKAFFAATEALKFEFIDTARMIGMFRAREEDAEVVDTFPTITRTGEVVMAHARRVHGKARTAEEPGLLASRVQLFAREALGNYRRFFATNQPELFPKILESLTTDTASSIDPAELQERLEHIYHADVEARRMGLEAEQWDYKKLTRFLEPQVPSQKLDHVLTVLSTYVEALESRVAERQLVAERLRIFEHLVNSFFENKRIRVNARKGFDIVASNDKPLREEQLSSGEYHLLYLMVTALVTQRRGSVIAIDEPEMSMHLKWQRQLVHALIECASNAQPQFVFATHSPDIAAEYTEFMIPLGGTAATEALSQV
jgi:ABC-type transport system involved in cytochrome c biogenesis ATPase subunit